MEHNEEKGDGFVTDYSRLMSDNSSYNRLALKLYVKCLVRFNNNDDDNNNNNNNNKGKVNHIVESTSTN